MEQRVLIVDDESEIREVLKDAFSLEPYDVLTAESAKVALALLAQKKVDAVISDEKMPGMSGTEFLSVVRNKFPETIRIILTGHASLESAISAINEGEIYRFFTKPCNVVDLVITVRQALQQKELMEKSQHLLKLVKRQSAIIEDMEKQYPGLTKVKRNAKGAVIIDDEIDDDDWDSLTEQIGSTVKECEEFFGKGV